MSVVNVCEMGRSRVTGSIHEESGRRVGGQGTTWAVEVGGAGIQLSEDGDDATVPLGRCTSDAEQSAPWFH